MYIIFHISFLLSGLVYRLLPPSTKLGQGYVFTGVCDSVHRGGCLPQCMLGCHTPPRSRHPPGTRYTAWDQGPGKPPGTRYTPPPGPGTPPWEQTLPRDQVHPPWEQTPPGPGTPPWEQTLPRDQVHPPLGADTPWSRPPPPVQSMLEDTVNARAVRILLECNLVFKHFRFKFDEKHKQLIRMIPISQ